jgi:hypothetical protein
MRGPISKALALSVLGLSAAAGIAIGAPASTGAPSISGHPNFDSVLTCNEGSWSADAVTFDYAWTYSGGGPTIGTGPTLRVPRTVTGYAIVCDVTAHDTQGQTTSATSPAVTIGPGISTVRITKAAVNKGAVTFTAVAGPSAALAKTPNGPPYVVLDRRLNKTTVEQLGDLKVIHGRSGKFTISGRDTRGRHVYLVRFVPSAGTGYTEADATRTLRVK